MRVVQRSAINGTNRGEEINERRTCRKTHAFVDSASIVELTTCRAARLFDLGSTLATGLETIYLDAFILLFYVYNG